MEEPFFKKVFHGREGKNFFRKIYQESCSTQRTNDEIMPKGKKFTDTFSSNLKFVNLNIFPDQRGM